MIGKIYHLRMQTFLNLKPEWKFCCRVAIRAPEIRTTIFLPLRLETKSWSWQWSMKGLVSRVFLVGIFFFQFSTWENLAIFYVWFSVMDLGSVTCSHEKDQQSTDIATWESRDTHVLMDFTWSFPPSQFETSITVIYLTILITSSVYTVYTFYFTPKGAETA
jgi:hypothetical protein